MFQERRTREDCTNDIHRTRCGAIATNTPPTSMVCFRTYRYSAHAQMAAPAERLPSPKGGIDATHDRQGGGCMVSHGRRVCVDTKLNSRHVQGGTDAHGVGGGCVENLEISESRRGGILNPIKETHSGKNLLGTRSSSESRACE